MRSWTRFGEKGRIGSRREADEIQSVVNRSPAVDCRGAAGCGAAGQLRSGPALLARRQAHPARHPEREAGGVRGTNCLRAEEI